MRFRLLFLLALIFPLSANALTTDWVPGDHIKARIVAEDNKFGVEIQTDQDWHTYYKDPGEAGVPTTFNWEGSSDIKVNEVVFPPAQPISEYNIKTNIYTGDVFFPVKAEFQGNPHVQLKLEGAICNNICMGYSLHLSADLPPGYRQTQKADESKEDISGSYWLIAGTAFLAGLILNIMPCVLPVLSLKVLGVLRQTGVERKRARFNFVATSFGIIFSFWILAAFAIFFKNTGAAFGWGLHFQSPVFVAVLMVITLIFSISLLGFFHLRPPSWIAGSGENNTAFGNFCSGVLATLLGTSCTAPIVVTAVGFALSGSYTDIFFVFTLMGLGMSLPYLLFAIRPEVANILPKPGGWMIRVKHFMGVLLLLTSVWLGYIIYGQLTAQETTFDEAKIAEYVGEGDTVLVDITAEWCLNCKVNKLRVLDTDKMQGFLHGHKVVFMQGDMTRPSKVLIDYIRKYNRYGIPFNMVYGPNAKNGILLPTLLTAHEVEEAVGKAEAK